MKKKLIFFILLITFIKVNTQLYDDNHIYQIFDSCINGTSLIIPLDEFKGENIYFSYDFNPQCFFGHKKDKSYFILYISDLNLTLINSKKPLKFSLEKKNITDINGVEEIKNLDWKDIKALKKYKKDNERIYFYEVILNDKEINTALFRLPTNGAKTGTITFIQADDISYDYNKDGDYEENFKDDDFEDTDNVKDKDDTNDEDFEDFKNQTIKVNKGNSLQSKITYLILIILLTI